MKLLKLSRSGPTAPRASADPTRTAMCHKFICEDSVPSAAVRGLAAAGYVSGRTAGLLRLLDDSFSLHRLHVKSVPD